MSGNLSKNKHRYAPTVWPKAVRWAFVLAVGALLGVVLSYYWRVFYGLDARGIPPLWPTLLCVGLGVGAGAVVLVLRRVKDFAARGAVCILLCGICLPLPTRRCKPLMKPNITCVPMPSRWGGWTLTPTAATPRMSPG